MNIGQWSYYWNETEMKLFLKCIGQWNDYWNEITIKMYWTMKVL